MTSHSEIRARRLLRLRNRDTCRWCGIVVVPPTDERPLTANVRTFDHLLPRERGRGIVGIRIVDIACNRCNEARAVAGHCYAAFVCAQAVMGEDVTLVRLNRFFWKARRRCA